MPTPVGVLDRDKKLGVVKEMTEIVAAAAGDPGLAERTWVLISEAPDGGWGIDGHAYTNAEIAETAETARRQITETWVDPAHPSEQEVEAVAKS